MRVRNSVEAAQAVLEWNSEKKYDLVRYILTPDTKEEWGFVAHVGLIDSRMNLEQIRNSFAELFTYKGTESWTLQLS